MDRKFWMIRNVSGKTRLKFRLMAAARHISLAKLLETIADDAWARDKTKTTERRKVARIIERYPDAADSLTGGRK